MNFEEAEIDYSLTPTPKTKILGVIVLTDNRTHNSHDKNHTNDFRCSAFKETQVDPLEFALTTPNHLQDENIMAQLTKRVSLLEARVEALSKLEGEMCLEVEVQRRNLKKKNRRKFKELIRDNVCPNCQKAYGSETALKYHVKLKHSPASNHSQSQ